MKQKQYCDCCGAKFKTYSSGKVDGWVVYTTEGTKKICSSCNVQFNEYDKLPKRR